jgi:hypothetical protein
MTTTSMSEIVDAHEDGRVSLRPNAACTHETGEDMYDSYGWHASSEIFGDARLQTVKYGWLDDGLEDKYILKAHAGCPLEGTEYTSREDLLTAARMLWPDATLEDDADYLYDAAGEQELAEIEYQPADPVERTILALGWPDSAESDREIKSERRALAESLVGRARNVREDMDGIESLLDDAVTAYESGDLDAVIEALQNASSAENDHGDDPATSELIHDLLQIEEEEE